MTTTPVRGKRQDPLDEAFARLGRMLPKPLARGLGWLHDPKSRWVRIPFGILFIAGGLLWFLPVLGIEMLPIGLLLVAQDVPFLRVPVGRMTLYLLDVAENLARWWKAWRARRKGRR